MRHVKNKNYRNIICQSKSNKLGGGFIRAWDVSLLRFGENKESYT